MVLLILFSLQRLLPAQLKSITHTSMEAELFSPLYFLLILLFLYFLPISHVVGPHEVQPFFVDSLCLLGRAVVER